MSVCLCVCVCVCVEEHTTDLSVRGRLQRLHPATSHVNRHLHHLPQVTLASLSLLVAVNHLVLAIFVAFSYFIPTGSIVLYPTS